MNLLQELRHRFAASISKILADVVDPPSVASVLSMIRATQDPKFGDYQANCAMPLQKTLGKPPRDIAAEIVAELDIADICDPPEVAGPGFINLRLRDDFLAKALNSAAQDDRLAVPTTKTPKTVIVDFSSPNVAKPMHVGHIRSTVIGDSICRTLRFLGHRAISDNHLGDWGTQFGMIIYGYKNFGDEALYAKGPVLELSRLYRLVNQLIGYHAATVKLPPLESQIAQDQSQLAELNALPVEADKKAAKKQKEQLKSLTSGLEDKRKDLESFRKSLQAVDSSPDLAALAAEHTGIGQGVLAETAKLHSGDEANLRLWNEFMPHCRLEIQQIYDRLDISFDHELGESFYHDQLASVVTEMQEKGFARESDGAMCIFLEGFSAPMIIRKQDGAYLYATTDLATIKYRVEQWDPDEILYVVDKRQGEHFDKLFAAAHQWGFDRVAFTLASALCSARTGSRSKLGMVLMSGWMNCWTKPCDGQERSSS
jgi:arginyl-tRNA synthetase